jgi:hypothetical protein
LGSRSLKLRAAASQENGINDGSLSVQDGKIATSVERRFHTQAAKKNCLTKAIHDQQKCLLDAFWYCYAAFKAGENHVTN